MLDNSEQSQYPNVIKGRDPLRGAYRSVMHRAHAAKETAANQLITAVERMRAEAFQSGDPDMIRQTQQLTRSMQRTAIYLHGHTFDQMTTDAAGVVRSKPWQAVMIAFVMGIIFGRSFARFRDRY